ncbi:MAG: formate--tetrahydrofolate ligase, partial [Clostridia bacterium]|nr:formate--tetrahydrofolate ligase [Clostridia bacterium]
NAFPTDTDAELKFVEDRCNAMGIDVVLSEVWAKGGDGGVKLAEKVVEIVEKGEAQFTPLYDLDMPAKQKIEKICKEIYGAESVDFASKALKDIAKFEEDGVGHLPICMAKTQYSLSDDPKLIGRPTGFTVTIREVKVSAGAGFLVALTGDIMRMPGLPKVPAANKMDLLPSGEIIGLF